MTSRISVPPFGIAEKRIVPFDFAAGMVAGQTIASSVATSSVYSGIDEDPDIINGATSNSGTTVSVTIGGDTFAGELGVIYVVQVVATMATPTEKQSMTAYIAFIPSVPAEDVVPYLPPAFTAFDISGISSPMEVGASFGPDVTFTWTTSNSDNVEPNSIDINDAGVDVATNLADDSTEDVTLGGAVTRTTAGTHAFGIAAENTIDGAFTRALTKTWLWRLYYGVETSATLTDAEILALPSSSLKSGYAGIYVMGAGGYKYLCFSDLAGGQINSVTDTGTLFPVAMATGSFTDGGGFGYEKVSVTNIQGVTSDVRVYRTFNSLGGAITVSVT